MRGRARVIKKETRREIANAVRVGFKQADVAQRFGVSQSTVNRIAAEYGGEGATGGDLLGALCIASNEAQAWILEQVPEGGTLAEYLVEVALDLYFEQEGKAA